MLRVMDSVAWRIEPFLRLPCDGGLLYTRRNYYHRQLQQRQINMPRLRPADARAADPYAVTAEKP